MKHKILIIDDEYNERKSAYLELTNKDLLGSSSVDDLEIEFLESPKDLPLLLSTNKYRALLIDVVLDFYWKNFTLYNVIEILDDRTPFALVSAKWDRTSSREVNFAWNKPNCKAFMHWRDISGNGDIQYALFSLYKIIADDINIDRSLNMDPNDPIRILHISDLHYGGFDEEKAKLEAQRTADKIIEYWDEKGPTFIVLSGDIAEHGLPIEYNEAKDWLEHFINCFNFPPLPTKRLFIVPGNHDVCLPFSCSPRVKVVKDENQKLKLELNEPQNTQKNLINYSYRPFEDFYSKVCECPLIKHDASKDGHSSIWIETSFRHLGVVFYGINTAQPPSTQGLPNRKVNPNDLANIDKRLSIIGRAEEEENKPVIIGVSHHCPISAHEDRSVVNPDEFEKFFSGRNHTSLFLHGHIHSPMINPHSPGGYRLIRICSSTFSKEAKDRPQNSLRGFVLIDLIKKDNIIKSLKATPFHWLGDRLQDVGGRNFRRDKDGMFRE